MSVSVKPANIRQYVYFTCVTNGRNPPDPPLFTCLCILCSPPRTNLRLVFYASPLPALVFSPPFCSPPSPPPLLCDLHLTHPPLVCPHSVYSPLYHRALYTGSTWQQARPQGGSTGHRPPLLKKGGFKRVCGPPPS